MSFGGGGSGSGSISGSTDVALSNPADGQVLTYDGTLGKWKNAAGSGVPTLANAPSGMTFTVYKNGANWVYNGVTITSRPSSRTDLTMIAISTDGTVPSFALAGIDIVMAVPS